MSLLIFQDEINRWKLCAGIEEGMDMEEMEDDSFDRLEEFVQILEDREIKKYLHKNP